MQVNDKTSSRFNDKLLSNALGIVIINFEIKNTGLFLDKTFR